MTAFLVAASIWVRITFYLSTGSPMADGTYPYVGAAACSQWMPTGTLLLASDGRELECRDRGLGDWYWSAWVDVFELSYGAGLRDVEATYGPYTSLEVERWGR